MKNLGVALFAVLLSIPNVASAQSLWWVDGGEQHLKAEPYDGCPNGGTCTAPVASTNRVLVGGGVSTFKGIGGPNASTAVGVSAEGRTDMKGGGADAFMSGDVGLRFRNLTWGPGVNLSIQKTGKVDDTSCRPSPFVNISNCDLTTGKRDLGGFAAFGFGGYLKATFGPQGRAFAQIREAFWPGATSAHFGTVGTSAGAFEGFSDNWESRVAFGYVLGGGRSTTVVRGQFSYRTLYSGATVVNTGREFILNHPYASEHAQFTVGIGRTF